MQRESIFDKMIPPDAAKKLAESFVQGAANDNAISALLSPRSYDSTVRLHTLGDIRLQPLDDPVSPVQPNITTYEVKLRPMSANELALTRRTTFGSDLQALAAEYLARNGYNPIYGGAHASFGSPNLYDPTDVDDRRPGDPYDVADYTGRRLVADPRDKSVSNTHTELERSQYDGNLYAFKTLILTATGKPRSYYRNHGVWSSGWQDARCLARSEYYGGRDSLADILHEGSTDPLPAQCECGFHAWYDVPPSWESPRVDALTSIPVVVQIAGDVLYAERGVRCEHAKVVAVVDCGNDDDTSFDRKDGRPYPTRAELGEYFGVPVLSPDSVYTWAVVEGLRPAAERMQELMREAVSDD